MLLSTGVSIMAQTQETVNNNPVQYYFFTNNIPSEWNYPLVGFVNNVNGNHASLQVGIVNSTSGNFGGVQAGLINSVAGNVKGVQAGLINSVAGDFYGIQYGLINSNAKTILGLQIGFINSNGETTGLQVGFINSSGSGTTGVQAGFINSSGQVNGVQAGFINSAESLSGVQLGFINSVDNLEKGLPIGFLSFVKHGGYKAIEVSYNDISPLNIAFKTGVREFYTYPVLAYDWRLDNDRLSFGYGFGSNLDLSDQLFVNPEVDWLHQVSLDFNHYTTIRCNFGYNVSDNFEVVAGPSLVWQFKINADDFHENYTVWDPSIVAINKLKAGFNVAFRYKF